MREVWFDFQGTEDYVCVCYLERFLVPGTPWATSTCFGRPLPLLLGHHSKNATLVRGVWFDSQGTEHYVCVCACVRYLERFPVLFLKYFNVLVGL